MTKLRPSDGFTLVEVMVALLLMGLLTAAVVPMLSVALRTGTLVTSESVARNLAQAQFERMRNLPYRISNDTALGALSGECGSTASRDGARDLLDRYYPNGDFDASSTSSEGFVAAGAARRAGEPNGAFFRTCRQETVDGRVFMHWIAVQFLRGDTVVDPGSSYTGAAGEDHPPTSLVGVTLNTEWAVNGETRTSQYFARIADMGQSVPLVNVEASVSALQVESRAGSLSTDPVLGATSAGLDLLADIGADARGSAYAVGTEVRADGSALLSHSGFISAPPSEVSTAASWPGTTVTVTPDAAVTVPSASSSALTITAADRDLAAGSQTVPLSLTASSGLQMTAPAEVDVRMGLTADVVVAGAATARGWYETEGSPTTAAVVTQDVVGLLPTTFAPGGIIQVKLDDARMSCSTDAASEVSYAGSLRYWVALPSSPDLTDSDTVVSAAGYTDWLSLSASQTSDPLEAINLAVDLTGQPTHQSSDGAWWMLGHYLAALSSTTSSEVSAAQSADDHETRLAPVTAITLESKPLTTAPDSAVQVALGMMSCRAADRR